MTITFIKQAYFSSKYARSKGRYAVAFLRNLINDSDTTDEDIRDFLEIINS